MQFSTLIKRLVSVVFKPTPMSNTKKTEPFLVVIFLALAILLLIMFAFEYNTNPHL